jgi:hypothetical protein
MANHYEVVLAKTYYGKHATGSVLLKNGHPEFHGKTSEAKKLYWTLIGASAKRSAIARESTPKRLYTLRKRSTHENLQQ